MKGACHCGAVRFELAERPAWVLDCNCSICRRLGALWAYPSYGTAKIVSAPDPGATDSYLWGDRALAFQRCHTCGCVTHIMAVMLDPPELVTVNARMLVGLDPTTTELRQIDNGHSGVFWTRSESAPMASRHPPPPGPEDLR